MQKKFPILVALAVFFTIASSADACSVCFGRTEDKAMTDALKYGVLSLLFVILGVLILFANFFISFQKRSKQLSQ